MIGRVDVEEAALLEELVDGERERIAHAEDGAERVRARAQVGDLAQELHGVPLLLQGVGGRIGGAVDVDLGALSSTACPSAGDATSSPATRTQAPVVDVAQRLVGDRCRRRSPPADR